MVERDKDCKIQDQPVKSPTMSAQLSNSDPILAANAPSPLFGRYLTIGLGAALAAGICKF